MLLLNLVLDAFLECAEEAPAGYLVTGNKHHFPRLWKSTKFDNAVFARADAGRLRFPDAPFDPVSCQHAFHHITKPELVLREMMRVTTPQGRLLVLDPLDPESDVKFELFNHLEKLRDPSHTSSLRLTTLLSMFEAHGLEVSRQPLRRQRPFNQWMRRAGLEPGQKRCAETETRKQTEDSMPGDKAGFSGRVDGGDIQIIHNEGMFLARRVPAGEG
jgi:SAM-dependent methyltransferase